MGLERLGYQDRIRFGRGSGRPFKGLRLLNTGAVRLPYILASLIPFSTPYLIISLLHLVHPFHTMPVSHVGLTVSHLPSACSFFLSALQPLGYRYIGKQDDQAGFGVDDADFFLSSEFAG